VQFFRLFPDNINALSFDDGQELVLWVAERSRTAVEVETTL